jgi:hypothetical protein
MEGGRGGRGGRRGERGEERVEERGERREEKGERREERGEREGSREGGIPRTTSKMVVFTFFLNPKSLRIKGSLNAHSYKII